MNNFTFLKKYNKNLYSIISEAENLFRDEYFEQVMVQTRRFAENLCRDLLEDKVSENDTFDFIINKIQDASSQNIRLKEFTDDLFFIKKHGNQSAHSSIATKEAEIALECLERAFEISILYCNVKFGYDKELDKLAFSEELLMTGTITKKQTLKERYKKALNDERENYSVQMPDIKKTKTKQDKIKSTKTTKTYVKKAKTKPKNYKVDKDDMILDNFIPKEEKQSVFCIIKNWLTTLFLVSIASVSIYFISKIFSLFFQ